MWTKCLRRCLLLSSLAVTLVQGVATAANDEVSAFEAAFDRGYAMQKQGRFPESIQYYERALAILPRVPNAPNSDNLLNNLADLYKGHDGKDPERAEELYQAALKLRIERYGLKDRRTLRTFGSLALLSVGQQNWEDATQRYQRLLDLQKQVFPVPSAEVAETLSDLGRIALAQSRHTDAQRLLTESLRMYEAALGPGHSQFLSTLTTLAIVEAELGRLDEANRLLARALAVAQSAKEGRSRHFLLSMTYLTMAELSRSAGRFGEAERAYQAVLTIDKKSPELMSGAASMALDLGGLYFQMGLYDKAAAAYQESVDLAQKWGTNSPNYGMLLAFNWGSLARERGDYAEAERLLQKALDLSTTLNGSDNVKTVAVLDNLGVLYMRMERWSDAAGFFRQASETLEKSLGPEHPLFGHSLVNLAAAMSSAGDNTQARGYVERALVIYRTKFGDAHPSVIDALNRLARLDAVESRWNESLALLNEARRGARRHISQVLPDLSPPEQLQFLIRNDGWALTNALSIAAANRDNPAMRDSAVGWVLNSKGVAQEAISQRTREARTASDTRAARLIEQLQLVRGRLIALRGKAAQSAQAPDDLAAQIKTLAQQEARFEADLAAHSGLAHRADPWVELSEVRGALGRGMVLVEMAKTQLFDFTNDRENGRVAPSRYLAWVVPAQGEGDVQMLDLGPADAIDAAVASAREALQAAPETIDNDGHVHAERAAREPLAALSRLVLEPLLPHLTTIERIALSPDSSLWLVPWSALTLPDGRYAVEQYDLRYVISGRDLANVVKPLPTSRPVVFADPDYDLGPADVRAATQKILHKSVPAMATSSVEDARLNLHVDRLPGTADEAKAIVPSLEQLSRAKPQVYTDRWALEGVFKALHQPRTLVASTHGFFLSDQVVVQRQELASSDSRGPVLDQNGARLENPLLRCGLLLAGCNHAAGNNDDGVLTGLEITGIDLRGTELVVLSACQTGIGDLHTGEGVAGLRQAFQLAGAQAVIATLWQIDDQETITLMSDLFSNLAAGETKAKALRLAQLRSIARQRASFGATHPYYWAAFTLTGQ